MNPTIKVTGAEKVIGTFRQVGERVVSGARQMMHRAADKVLEDAKINAPEDFGDLAASIRKEVVSRGERGRLEIDIVVGGQSAGADIDRYAELMHENYDSIIAESETDAHGRVRRARTKAKQAAHPDHIVGGKFLDRALEAQRGKLEPKMTELVTVIIKEESK